ncbi:MAG: hypothetical protein KGL95_11840, partial [Patescibacteria group bacterium]|nr:hypothetical protein [Patescibacteria group bacterium]
MPTKKKAATHPKKKVETTTNVEEPTSEPKVDRPVMQVVQVPEGEGIAPVAPSTEAVAPVAGVNPPSQPAEEPVVGTAVVMSAPVEEKKETSEAKPETPPIATEATQQTKAASTASTTPVASETFAEELPPVKESSKKGLIVILVLLLLLACGAVGGYLYMNGSLKIPATLTTLLHMKKPVAQVTVAPTTAVTPTPTPAAVDKSKYTIEVLNGSG